MGSHTLKKLKKLSFDEIKKLFEATMKRVKDFVLMESDRLVPKISTGGSKRTTETKHGHEGTKRQKTNKEQSAKEEKELSEEELQKLMMIVPVEEVYVEALQVMSHPAKAETRGVNKNGYHHNTWCLYREY
ncbi:hypothetical protein Tco_1424507 [Tanacetum coccineum]